jgi:hypothetical protein
MMPAPNSAACAALATPAAPHRRRLYLRLLNGALMSDLPMTLGGTCNPRFDPLRELFAAKLESGEDLGASLGVNIHGHLVVDRWGGCRWCQT